MENEPQCKLVLDRLSKNLDEMTELIKRTGDRVILVLGATATAFGLIMRMSPPPQSDLAIGLVILAIASLASCFVIAILALMPKEGEQPGSTDVDEIWEHLITKDMEAAAANAMNDLCRVIRHRRTTNERMNRWFTLLLFVSGLTLALVSSSQIATLV